MLRPSLEILTSATRGGYALGAFNVYNLEGVLAAIRGAEAERSPVIVQMHPAALGHGGAALAAAAMAAADAATVPVAVHLDHSSTGEAIRAALAAGIGSVMADGSALDYDRNVSFTKEMAALAHENGATLEAELGRLSGTEDGLTIAERDARMTDPSLAADFVSRTAADSLAICIGNQHGVYRTEPVLDFDRLAAIRERVGTPLVLHGASGLPASMVTRAIDLGVAKFNVNTELRQAFLAVFRKGLENGGRADVLDLLTRATEAMQKVVAEKLRLFRSSGRA